jgi:hypothetical protein
MLGVLKSGMRKLSIGGGGSAADEGRNILDDATSRFQILVCEAKDLMIGDLVAQSSDPYIVVQLGSQTKHQTATVKHNLNPTFNEVFCTYSATVAVRVSKGPFVLRLIRSAIVAVRVIRPFRVAPERVHNSHFRSFCVQCTTDRLRQLARR